LPILIFFESFSPFHYFVPRASATARAPDVVASARRQRDAREAHAPCQRAEAPFCYAELAPLAARATMPPIFIDADFSL
jgi:hypothetical protein